MSVQKCRASFDFNVDGRAYAKYAQASTGVFLERGVNRPYSSGNLNLQDQSPAAWTTVSAIDSTGTVIFNNLNNGGSLTSVTLANRGTQNLYVGFNNSNPSVASGFMVATGEAIQLPEDEVITRIWAIAPALATGSIAGVGFFQSTKYWEPN
jgi:hypothetical protein